jgi:hypothetical protein
MKRFTAITLACCLLFTLSAFAGGDKGKGVKVHGVITDPMCAKSGDKAKMENADCAKKCAEKDGKLAFVNFEDGKVWMIENNDAVKGHEGHHVSIDAHANDDAGTLHITKVSMYEAKASKKEDKKSE